MFVRVRILSYRQYEHRLEQNGHQRRFILILHVTRCRCLFRSFYTTVFKPRFHVEIPYEIDIWSDLSARVVTTTHGRNTAWSPETVERDSAIPVTFCAFPPGPTRHHPPAPTPPPHGLASRNRSPLRSTRAPHEVIGLTKQLTSTDAV